MTQMTLHNMSMLCAWLVDYKALRNHYSLVEAGFNRALTSVDHSAIQVSVIKKKKNTSCLSLLGW